MKTRIIVLLTVMMTAASCLELQTWEKYEGKSKDLVLNKSCWEYLQDNRETYPSMIRAIELAGLEECYSQSTEKYTFILLSEKAISSYVNNLGDNPSQSQMLKLRSLLLFHIIRGQYDAYSNLTYSVQFVDTLLEGDERMSVVLQRILTSRGSIDRIQFMADCGSSNVVTAVRSNYLLTNGAAHVVDSYCQYKD